MAEYVDETSEIVFNSSIKVGWDATNEQEWVSEDALKNSCLWGKREELEPSTIEALRNPDGFSIGTSCSYLS